MYNNISKQISTAQEERQQVLILEYFNAKVGTFIEGNKPPVTKGGGNWWKWQKKYDLVIINKEKEICEGLWTRVQSLERSILDYLLTNSKLLSRVTEMIVDENKQYSVFKLEQKWKNIPRRQCNTTNAKPRNSNRETKEEQNNYQMWIQKI